METMPPYVRNQPARFALDATPTRSTNATTLNSGMDHRPILDAPQRAALLTTMAQPSAVTGRNQMAAPSPTEQSSMNAQGVEAANMVLSAVRARREDRPLTPYKPDAWLMALTTFDLLHRYPNVYTGLRFGFSTNIPPLMNTFTPPNNLSIRANQNIFDEIINKEFAKGRYIGPYSKAEIEDAIGHFQTSPLSLVPKPGKPGKFRLVQNLSFPHRPNLSTPSINSFVHPDRYPSSYSTFPIVCLLISTLPQGAQGAVRDVAKAYRTVPLHPSQWHALVVRLQDDSFAVDTAFCFGFTASGGIYGSIGGAGTDIMRAHGIGPILRWVDDHLFIRIPRSAIPDFNTNRANTANRIAHLGGPRV